MSTSTPAGAASASWLRDPFTWLSGALVIGALTGLGQLVAGVLSPRTEAPPSVRGVPLGASAAEVRDRFEAPSSQGGWRAFEDGDVHVLEWRDDGAAVRYRYELHAGLVVAVRATVPDTDPWARGEAIAATPSTVVTRSLDGGTVDVAILSRDCPAHADEVKRVLARR